MNILFAFPEHFFFLNFPHLTLHSWRLNRHGLHQQVPSPVSSGWIWTVGCTGQMGVQKRESRHGLAVAVSLSKVTSPVHHLQ